MVHRGWIPRTFPVPWGWPWLTVRAATQRAWAARRRLAYFFRMMCTVLSKTRQWKWSVDTTDCIKEVGAALSLARAAIKKNASLEALTHWPTSTSFTQDWLTFGASLKSPFKELQFLAFLHWLHSSVLEVAAWLIVILTTYQQHYISHYSFNAYIYRIYIF